MALIKCPECGRENVSNTAEACPDCGYNIKAYFEEKERELELKKLEEKWEAKHQAALKERMDKIGMPSEPKIGKGIIIYSATVFTIITLLIINSYSDITLFQVFSVYFTIVGLPLFIYFVDFPEKKKKFELACQDFEAYKRKIIEEEDRREAIKMQETYSSSVKCPNCGSMHVKKISTLNRAVSVGAVGLASSKIGKQFQCNSCKYKW